MQGEFKHVVNEKNYWTERLYRTMKAVTKKTGVKKRRIEPLNKTRFILNNQKFFNNKSKLLTTGMLTMRADALPSREQTNVWHKGSSFKDYSGSGRVHGRSLSPSRLERMRYESNSVTENQDFDSQYADGQGSLSFIYKFLYHFNI